MTVDAIRGYLPLFKIRICSLIALSAVVGLVSVSSAPVSGASLFFLVLATMMSSAGASAFNHYYDLDIDSLMKRTTARPLPAGTAGSPKVVLLIAVLLFAASILVSLRALNHMVGLHLFLGGFVYAVVYTVWLKRRSALNIIIGGLAGSFAVLAGGASATPELCMAPVLLSVVMFFWTPSHFWSFAIVHREEYEKASIPMLPSVVGDKFTARCILVNTAVMVGLSLLPVFLGYLGLVYACAAVLSGAFFLYRNCELLKDTSKAVAWKNFKASMVYLAVLFAAVIVEAAVA